MSATKKGKYIRKRALALTLALLLSLCLLPAPSQAVGSSLTISTAEELTDFLKSCSLDSYSKGLSVTLAADLDLRGGTLKPAPIFYGSFDGGGFEISGFVINAKGSQIGLFRSLEAGSTVSDLSLRGEVAPGGSACCVGMLCGENRGTISGCTASGSVSGADDVGALAGVNAAEGKITASSSEAEIRGEHRAGGIAGSNAGVIEASKNSGNVRSAAESESAPELAEANGLSQTVSDPESSAAPDSEAEKASAQDKVKDTDAADSALPSDIGGITGLNMGAVRGCANQGSIGTEGTGSRIGGIAGRHKGILTACENDGEVRGGADVGGIAGRFEPSMALALNVSSGAELSSGISELTGSLRTLTDLLASASGGAPEGTAEINSAAAQIDKILQSSVSSASQTAPTADSLYGNLQIINTAAEKVSEDVSAFSAVASAEIPTITSELQTISTALEDAGVSAQAQSILLQTESITARTGSLSTALSSLQTLVSGVSAALQNENTTAQEKGEAVTALFEEYYGSIGENSVSAALDSISASAGSISSDFKTINSKLSKSSAVIVQSMQLISASAGRLSKGAAVLSSGAGTQASIINANLSKIETMVYGISGSEAARLQEAFGKIYVQLCKISAALTKVTSAADATDVEVYTALTSSIDRLDSVGQSLSAHSAPPLYSTVDVAENIEQSENPGQISSCRNNGAVFAEGNAGGIAGIMTFEAGTAGDEAVQSSAWADSASLFRAILMTSSNTGSVLAKAGCAGGVVGRCDIGAVYSSENTANVTVSSGSCSGGIAGFSGGSIISCDALSDVAGDDYVGGIAGQGRHLCDCRAMVRLLSDGECTGAIAGDADGDIMENAFVDEGLSGINGVSYAGAAEPMAYEDFINLEFSNPIFTDLTACFYIDGKLVKRVPLTYGGSIKEGDIPSIPPREDGFGRWAGLDSGSTLRSMTINAEFLPWLTAVYSAGDPALLYAEGQFSDKGTIEIENTTPKLDLREASRLISSFTYSLFDGSAPVAEEYTLHLLCEQKGDLSVFLVTDSGRKKLPSRRDGSYLVFQAPASGKLEIRASQTKKILLAVFIILVILILLCFYIYMQKHFPNEDKSKPERGDSPPDGTRSKPRRKKKTLSAKNRLKEAGGNVKALFRKKQESAAEKSEKPKAPENSEMPEKPEKAMKPKAPKAKREKKASPPLPPDIPDEPASPGTPPPYKPDGSRLNISIGDDGIDRRV